MRAARAATLPRAARLLRREHYAAALASGSVSTRRHFSMFTRPNGLSYARLGIIASKRVAPRAVDRNRVKRWVREAFRKARQDLAGWDIVIKLRRVPATSSGAVAGLEIGRLLEALRTPPRNG